ncbi:ParA family protein (plasmid) [Pseudomonas savastanoi pv. phaseolicola]|uniref:nucleotide-binding protein n=1 Tax=Pseudomonas TaxID=286 RepID=UPI0006B885D3|nr:MULTISPECIES: hypothetical protein [Pseudomonas]QDW03664.1 ParA family protein [Pseudomonas sp. KBS0707]RMQ57224.1 hypothetical protein ALQ01_200074 [Pseudomonas savastanoi pv. glycinea]
MALRIGTASQKGGVYKSAIARALATTYASAGWTVKICDLDIDQSTCHDWNLRRMKAGIEPIIRVETFGTFNQALKASSSDDVDLLIFDGGPQATAGTVDMGKSVDLMILPTGLSLDDLTPTVRLANKLVDKHGISPDRIALALVRGGDSDKEIVEARSYLSATPYHLLAGTLYEKVLYRRAHDSGFSVTEVSHKGLREQADRLVQSIVDRVSSLSEND